MFHWYICATNYNHMVVSTHTETNAMPNNLTFRHHTAMPHRPCLPLLKHLNERKKERSVQYRKNEYFSSGMMMRSIFPIDADGRDGGIFNWNLWDVKKSLPANMWVGGFIHCRLKLGKEIIENRFYRLIFTISGNWCHIPVDKTTLYLNLCRVGGETGSIYISSINVA